MTAEHPAAEAADETGGPADDRELDRLRRAVYAPGAPADAAARYRAALGSVGAAPAADAECTPAPEHGADRRRSALLAGVGAAAGLAVLVLLLTGTRSSLPGKAPSPTPVAFAPPAAAGTRVWSAHGVGSLPSSPVLDAAGAPIVVSLACRGLGTLRVIVDEQNRPVSCVAGRATQDSEYFTGDHGRFRIALSISAPVEWVLTVTAADAG